MQNYREAAAYIVNVPNPNDTKFVIQADEISTTPHTNEIIWFSSDILMIREEKASNYSVIRTKDGTRVGMLPANHKIIYP
jgi:hypothetical protein